MKEKFSFSKIGATCGLILGLTAASAFGLATLVLGRTLKKESVAYVQQSIGETTISLATHFKMQMENIFALLNDTHEELTQTKASVQNVSIQTPEVAQTPLTSEPPSPSETPEVSHTPVALQTPEVVKASMNTPSSIEINREILDISVWKKNAAASSQQGSSQEIVRDSITINPKYMDPSPTWEKDITSMTDQERPLIQPAFHGQAVVVLPPGPLSRKHLVLIATPMTPGISDQILVAHVRLDRFQSILIKEGLTTAVLLDHLGNILAHPNLQQIGTKQEASALLEEMQSSKLRSGQMSFEVNKARYMGGYSQVGIGQLYVLASVLESESTSGFTTFGKTIITSMISAFILFFVIGYFVYTRSGFLFYERRRNNSNESSGASANFENEVTESMDKSQIENTTEDHKPKKIIATVIHGSLRQLELILNTESPENAAETINDFFSIAESVLKEHGGIFERSSGSAFVGIWENSRHEDSGVWNSIKVAIELRKNFFKLNESRKVDGQKPIIIGMGIHTGSGLAARIGPVRSLKYTVVGDVIQCAKTLAQISVSHRTDLLISQEIWNQAESKLIGELLGEVKLTPSMGLVNFYKIEGLINENGEEIRVPCSPDIVESAQQELAVSDTIGVVVHDNTPKRWLVNNGTQIVGPLSAEEIASRLFAQELDFDCECWVDGIGTSAQIQSAKIFMGSEAEGASLWVYDGVTIHGPMNHGFLKTALSHGAIQGQVYICEGSTIKGWKVLSEWEKNQQAQLSPAAVSAEAVQAAKVASILGPVMKVSPETEEQSKEHKAHSENPDSKKKVA